MAPNHWGINERDYGSHSPCFMAWTTGIRVMEDYATVWRRRMHVLPHIAWSLKDEDQWNVSTSLWLYVMLFALLIFIRAFIEDPWDKFLSSKSFSTCIFDSIWWDSSNTKDTSGLIFPENINHHNYFYWFSNWFCICQITSITKQYTLVKPILPLRRTFQVNKILFPKNLIITHLFIGRITSIKTKPITC